MLADLVAALRTGPGLAGKADIAPLLETLAQENAQAVLLGDDCAAIADGNGWLLFAIEGFINQFVAADPWFAGYCGVLVNVSDITAMGGQPLAVVDAIWSRDQETGRRIMAGLKAGAAAYGVPVVGGHSNARNDREQLSVAILGRAERLLTSFDARPGDVLLAAIDLRGSYREPFPNWNASVGVDPARLRADLALLPALAGAGLCAAAKDISMAGVLGTAMMLLECSSVGAVIDVNAIPAPPDNDATRWLLSAFPSYGFLLAVSDRNQAEVQRRFAARDIACAAIGRCDDSRKLYLRAGAEQQCAWDFADSPLIGCGPGVRGGAAATANWVTHA